MLTKAKKEEIVSNLSKGIGEANSIVLVNFHGLTVADEYALRKNLREHGITYKVARKSLIKRALDGKASGELPELPGEVAVVYGQDVIAPAREVYNFEKDHKGVIQILGGIYEGKFQNSAYMLELATIPSRDVLLSKIAFLLKSPMQRLAIAVNEVAKTK